MGPTSRSRSSRSPSSIPPFAAATSCSTWSRYPTAPFSGSAISAGASARGLVRHPCRRPAGAAARHACARRLGRGPASRDHRVPNDARLAPSPMTEGDRRRRARGARGRIAAARRDGGTAGRCPAPDHGPVQPEIRVPDHGPVRPEIRVPDHGPVQPEISRTGPWSGAARNSRAGPWSGAARNSRHGPGPGRRLGRPVGARPRPARAGRGTHVSTAHPPGLQGGAPAVASSVRAVRIPEHVPLVPTPRARAAHHGPGTLCAAPGGSRARQQGVGRARQGRERAQRVGRARRVASAAQRVGRARRVRERGTKSGSRRRVASAAQRVGRARRVASAAQRVGRARRVASAHTESVAPAGSRARHKESPRSCYSSAAAERGSPAMRLPHWPPFQRPPPSSTRPSTPRRRSPGRFWRGARARKSGSSTRTTRRSAPSRCGAGWSSWTTCAGAARSRA